jgi:ABC-type microcin C transport system permease subunit YejE
LTTEVLLGFLLGLLVAIMGADTGSLAGIFGRNRGFIFVDTEFQNCVFLGGLTALIKWNRSIEQHTTTTNPHTLWKSQ